MGRLAKLVSAIGRFRVLPAEFAVRGALACLAGSALSPKSSFEMRSLAKGSTRQNTCR